MKKYLVFLFVLSFLSSSAQTDSVKHKHPKTIHHRGNTKKEGRSEARFHGNKHHHGKHHKDSKKHPDKEHGMR